MAPNGAHSDSIVPSAQASRISADGTPLEVLCQRYSDRILILVSQIGKVGCLYQVSSPTVSSSLSLQNGSATAPELAELDLPPPDPAAVVIRLLGTPPSEEDEALYELYARQIAAVVYADVFKGVEAEQLPPWAGRGVVVGIALKRREDVDDTARRQELAEIMRCVIEARVW